MSMYSIGEQMMVDMTLSYTLRGILLYCIGNITCTPVAKLVQLLSVNCWKILG